MLNNAQFRRIVSNYLRMGITFLFGICLLRIFLGFGEGVYAVIALTGSSIGIAEIFKETIRGATVPELGKSYYSEKKGYFHEIYSSTLLLSVLSACFSSLILGAFIIFLGSFNIPAELTEATKYYILTRMVYVFIAITLSPVHNMMPITNRMASYNLWITLDRASDLLAAVVVSYILIAGVAAEQLIMFSSISLILKLFVMVLATIWSAQSDKRFIPDPRLISKTHLKNVGQLIGWNAVAVISVNLYSRFDMIAVNILYGIKATVIFGLASQLAAYIFVSSMGFVSGLDSVVTQKSNRGSTKQKRDVFSLSTDIIELQTLILGFLFVILTLHTQFIISLLFADKIDATIDVTMIVICFFMLMSGMIARGMSEGWMSILTGLGKIKSYAIPVLIGASLNPILVIIIGRNFEFEVGLYYICFVFLVLNIIFHMYVVPRITASALDVKTFDLIKPVLVPMGLTLFTMVLASALGNFVGSEFWKLLLTLAVGSSILGAYFMLRISAFLQKQS